jgi:hypothetical protein
MDDDTAGPVERAVFGRARIPEVLNGYLTRRLGTEIAEVLFRGGRVDAVWGVRTTDGRDIVIKAHRSPPPAATAFLADYGSFRSLDAAEGRVAAAAACWAIAYHARCELSLLASPEEPAPGSALDLVRRHGHEYLNV